MGYSASRSANASGAAEPPLPRGVLLARRPEVPPVEVGPESVEEDELRVGRLPEQEVAGAVLTRAAHEQVDVRHVRLVEEAGDRRLVDLVGVQPAGRDLTPDGRGGVGDLGPAAVVHAHGQGEDVVVAGELLSDLELLDDAAPEPRTATCPADADPELVHLVAAPPDHVAVEAHEEPDLVGAAPPVLRGEGVRADSRDAQLDGALDAVEERGLPRLVAGRARQPALLGPAAVAVHDDRDVAGHLVGRDLGWACTGRVRVGGLDLTPHSAGSLPGGAPS